MTKQLGIWSVCVMVATFGAATAQAVVVGIDSGTAAYTGVGVLDTSSRTWNLVGDLGSFNIGADVVTLDYGSNTIGGANATIDLFDDYRHNGAGSAFGVALLNLDPAFTYNLVVYSAQNFLGGRGGLITLAEGGVGFASTTGDQQSSFVQGVNFVRFNGLVPDNSTLDSRIRFLVGNGPDGIGILNGFEIEAIAIVPEPATASLGLLGLAGLFLRRRRVA